MPVFFVGFRPELIIEKLFALPELLDQVVEFFVSQVVGGLDFAKGNVDVFNHGHGILF